GIGESFGARIGAEALVGAIHRIQRSCCQSQHEKHNSDDQDEGSQNLHKRYFYRRRLSGDSLPRRRKIMNTQKLLITLTAVNLGLLGYQVFQPHSAGAATAVVPAVLRGTGLEIVDARAKVR